MIEIERGFCFSDDLRRVAWFGLSWKSDPNQSNPNQSTYRQGQWKMCVHLFYGQDEDQVLVFKTLLVQFGLGIVPQEGFWDLWILGFFWSKSSNLEVQGKYGVWMWNGCISEKVLKFGERSMSMKCSLLCQGLSGSIQFFIFENFCMVLGGLKVVVEKSFSTENLKMVIG